MDQYPLFTLICCKLTVHLFRLVSVYYNKFSNKKRAGSWIRMSKEIIKLYRCKQNTMKWKIMIRILKLKTFPLRVEGGLEDDSDTPTPAEFIKLDTRELLSALYQFNLPRHVLHGLKYNSDVNPHWRPQHRCCPVCLLRFRWRVSIYSAVLIRVQL